MKRREREAHPWYRPTLLKVAVVVLAVLAILPTRANGQFGIDTAAILAALSKMQSLMNTFIATPLKTINQYEQSVAKYEQEVMYPLAAINQAKSSVMQFENQFNQVSGMFRVNVSSATLPQSQNLESLLLSRNAANVPIVSGQFQNVYGVVMAQNAASPQMRTMTDMTDAQAQDAMKRAIEIDALADAELNEANQMGQQISQAAPGSAPILEAEADVWVVRANAYTQAALAELMRTRGIDLANQSKNLKARDDGQHQQQRPHQRSADQQVTGMLYAHLHPEAMLAFFQATQLNLFERFLTQAMSGIDSTGITSGMQNVAYVVLVVGFLWQVYQSALHGGDVRGLGTSLIKYVVTAVVVMNYGTVFTTINQGFVNAGNWVSNASGAEVSSRTGRTIFRRNSTRPASNKLWGLITGSLLG